MCMMVLSIFISILIPLVCHAFTPIDNYLIDCGSFINTTVEDRIFLADSSLSSTLTSPNNILANTTVDPRLFTTGMPALYKTARIFTGPSSYSFPIKAQGWHFVRLHFFPFVYGDYNMTAATFSVSSQDLLLLRNFQPPANSSMKEYSLNINSENLILSFAPSGNSSVAFVNAIEVISVPHDLIPGVAQSVGTPRWEALLGQAFETVYRLNVGGRQLLPAEDTLWRIWENDEQFLWDGSHSRSFSFGGQIDYNLAVGATIYTAPSNVYGSLRELDPSNSSDRHINMTWKFNIDANCGYWMRFHFCDVVSLAAHSLYFNVRVGRWHVLSDFDLSSKTYDFLATAYYVDFVLDASDASNELFISISPSSLISDSPNGILNGLEIMKMNFSAGSPFTTAASDAKKNMSIVVGSVIGSVVIVIVAATFFLVFKRRKIAMNRELGTWTPSSTNGAVPHPSADGNSIGCYFSLPVLQEATNYFDESFLIGNGGFGKVYKGVLSDETRVAVKRGDTKLKQGLREFRNEIELLSRMRHRHLVSLLGYCDEKNEMILVYEYMEKGTLKSHLYGSDLPPLTWKQRLEICIGSARGLHYLHTSLTRSVIHRDVKSTNILLDENLTAKIADFGVSRIVPDMDQTHVTIVVKGSFGYIDPQYFRMKQLTQKSDVYSFGVVLLEVISARPVMSSTSSGELVGLVEWAMEWLIKEELEQIVDRRIAGTIKPASLQKFGETIQRCLANYGVERPLMSDVLWNLEYALRLQEFDSSITDINSLDAIPQLGKFSDCS